MGFNRPLPLDLQKIPHGIRIERLLALGGAEAIADVLKAGAARGVPSPHTFATDGVIVLGLTTAATHSPPHDEVEQPEEEDDGQELEDDAGNVATQPGLPDLDRRKVLRVDPRVLKNLAHRIVPLHPG